MYSNMILLRQEKIQRIHIGASVIRLLTLQNQIVSYDLYQ